LVQASSSLPISRTCAWPWSLPITEIYFRHFLREFVISHPRLFHRRARAWRTTLLSCKACFPGKPGRQFCGWKVPLWRDYPRHGNVQAWIVGGSRANGSMWTRIPRLCRGIVKGPASLYIGFYYWKQQFRILAWGSICSNPYWFKLMGFRPESNRGPADNPI